jgi:hypothetical protein
VRFVTVRAEIQPDDQHHAPCHAPCSIRMGVDLEVPTGVWDGCACCASHSSLFNDDANGRAYLRIRRLTRSVLIFAVH